jgi:hypothetical protein
MKQYNLKKENVFVCFFTVMLIGILIHSITLSYSPISWMDEVQIKEIARGGIFQKVSDWDMALVKNNGQLNSQSWAIYYIGGWFANLSCFLLGDSGARIINLLWLLVSTFLISFYAFRKTNNKILSVLVGLLYFSFPTLVQSVRGGRVDVIAFTFLFASLSVLQVKLKRSKFSFLLVCLLSSLLLACSVFSWITAVLCIPIVVYEFLEWLNSYQFSLQKKVFFIGAMLFFFMFTTILLVSPFFSNYYETKEFVTSVLMLNTSSNNEFNVKMFFKGLVAFPGVYIVSLSLVFFSRRLFFLSFSILLVSIIMTRTYCYGFRMLYLLPYALIILVLFFKNMKNNKNKMLYLYILFFMGGASFIYSILLRNVSEYFTKEFRSLTHVKEMFKKEIGENKRIYCDTFQLYSIGKNLNWKQYRVISKNESDIFEAIQNLNVEYYVTEKKLMTLEKSTLLNNHGFVLLKEITPFVLDNLSFVQSKLNRYNRLMPYGPYYLYYKTPK